MRGYLILTVMGLMVLSVQAQRVTNVTATQEGQKLRIQYELSTASPTEVGLYISENNGSTWSKVTQHLTGDVGPSVSGGSKQMVWDVLKARESLVGNAIVFKVKVASENKEIKSVKIGNQVWMAENLNVDHYRNGDPITNHLSGSDWTKTKDGAFSIYKANELNESIYGKLYNWYAVNDSRGLCPSGWHVPGIEEFEVLIGLLGGGEIAGGALKSKELWRLPNKGASNISGFGAIPAGARGYLGWAKEIEISSFFWSGTENTGNSAWGCLLSYQNDDAKLNYGSKNYGFSVRCVRD